MDIDVADAPPHQTMAFNEKQYFVVAGSLERRHQAQLVKNISTGFQVAAGKFANNIRVNTDLTGLQKLDKAGMMPSKMIDPDRRVDQYHFVFGRLLGATARLGWDPPRRARRRADSRSIKAVSASRNKALRSFTPLS